MTATCCVLAGFMIATSATSSHGMELRADRNTDLIDLVKAERRRNRGLADDIAREREAVVTLAQGEDLPQSLMESVDKLDTAGGMLPVSGPGLTVVLTDAPLDVEPEGVDPDLLVVHQQDIQAVVNILWQGGAEAMTLQGQRVVATTGIKCVGNTVVIHGVPYAPPYVISAIGDAEEMERALEASSFVDAYQKIAKTYQLGWEQRRERRLAMPAYTGAVELQYARAR